MKHKCNKFYDIVLIRAHTMRCFCEWECFYADDDDDILYFPVNQS